MPHKRVCTHTHTHSTLSVAAAAVHVSAAAIKHDAGYLCNVALFGNGAGDVEYLHTVCRHRGVIVIAAAHYRHSSRCSVIICAR